MIVRLVLVFQLKIFNFSSLNPSCDQKIHTIRDKKETKGKYDGIIYYA